VDNFSTKRIKRRELVSAALLASGVLAVQTVSAQQAEPAIGMPLRPTEQGTIDGTVVALPGISVTAKRYVFEPTYTGTETDSATRTNTPLINVPQSVQVLSHTLLEEQDRRTLTDALVNVSGVIPTKPEETLFTQPIVRGFPAEIYLDGLPFYGNSAIADPTSLTGVDSVEVVKGPSSTIYGGGAGAPLGGLINVVSARPTFEKSGYVALRTGSYATWNPYLDLNIPVNSVVAARIAADYQSNNSWIDHMNSEHWSVKPSVLFKIDPKTELLLRGQYDRRSSTEYSGLPSSQALAGQLDRDAFPGATSGQPRTTIANNVETAELTHTFNDVLKLTATGRYRESTFSEYGSFVYPDFIGPDSATPTTYPIFSIFIPATIKETTLDVNLLAKHVEALGGQHTLLAGVNFDYTTYFTGTGFTGVPIGNLDLAQSGNTLAFGASPELNSPQTYHYQTFAGYLQDQATYGRFHFLSSLRVTRLNQKQPEQGYNTTYTRVNPRFGVTFDLTSSVALYAAYATGFRGPNAYVGTAQPKPETSTNVEAGIKLALRELGLSGTIAVFDQTRRNVTTVDPDNPLNSIQAGEERARGVETDLTWEPTPAISVLVNYAYTNAKVTEDTTIPVGDRLIKVPHNSGRLALRYRFLTGPAAGLGIGAGMTMNGQREITLPNTVATPGYAVFDAQASYDFAKRYTLTLAAVNLSNRRAYDPYQYLSSVVIPIQPRSVYLTLKVRM